MGSPRAIFVTSVCLRNVACTPSRQHQPPKKCLRTILLVIFSTHELEVPCFGLKLSFAWAGGGQQEPSISPCQWAE